MSVQPDSSKTLSKGFSGVVAIAIRRRNNRNRGRRRSAIVTELASPSGPVADGDDGGGILLFGLPGALGKSLTSGLQDHVQRFPPRGRPQLEGLGQVVLGGDPAEEGFFFLG